MQCGIKLKLFNWNNVLIEMINNMLSSIYISYYVLQILNQCCLFFRDVEGSASSSFGSYANYLGSSCKTEISNSGPENCALSDMCSTAPQNLQLSEQFPNMPYNFNLLNSLKFQPGAEINPLENPVDYHVNGSFEAPRPGYDSKQHGWGSTSGPCADTMFDEHLYSQASFI